MVVLSAAIASALIWLIYFKGKVAAPDWVEALPAANASLNSLSALSLILGYINIRRGNRIRHRQFMLSATVFSALFLVSYVIYHFFSRRHHISRSRLDPPYIFLYLNYPHRVVDSRTAFYPHHSLVRASKPVLFSPPRCPLDVSNLALRLDHRSDHLWLAETFQLTNCASSPDSTTIGHDFSGACSDSSTSGFAIDEHGHERISSVSASLAGSTIS